MTTGASKVLPKPKAVGAQRAPVGSKVRRRALVSTGKHPEAEPALGVHVVALLGRKAEDLERALERMRLKGPAPRGPVAMRTLATDLQQLSFELLRVSVRLVEEGKTSRESATASTAGAAVAHAPADLQAVARRNREALVRAGDLIPSGTLADRLQISPQAVTKARSENRFFSLEVAGDDYYPSFFADPGLDRKVLEDIARKLGDLPGAEKLVFFRSALGSLGDLTPLEALRAGKREAVERAAVAFAQR